MKQEELVWDVEVRASSTGLNIPIKELSKYWDLIFLFVHRTFVAQYKQTILGPAWAIIQPFFTTVVYSVFFGDVAGLDRKSVV